MKRQYDICFDIFLKKERKIQKGSVFFIPIFYDKYIQYKELLKKMALPKIPGTT